MSTLSREDVLALTESRETPSVSIFVPTARAGAGAETLQNPIRFKNLLREAEEQLGERGLRGPEVEDFLEPARRLVDDDPFWQHQAEGLALFRSPDLFRTYELPFSVSELAVVQDRFHLKPLLRVFEGEGRFYVLAPSMNDVRLIEASRDSARELDLGDTPRSLAEAMGEELTRETWRWHVNSPSAQARTAAPAYSGQGTGEDDAKVEIRTFFDRVEVGLRALQLDRRVPVVLAGVDYLLPIYREATGDPALLDAEILGNPEMLRAEELRDRAWPLVEPHFLEARRRAQERYRGLAGTGLASSRLDEVVVAAHDGRIDTLFAASGVRRWGAYDLGTRKVRFDERMAPGSGDLVDLAAVQTFVNGGAVHVVEPGEVPEAGEPVAAIFRY
jgi:hypothetical protein